MKPTSRVYRLYQAELKAVGMQKKLCPNMIVYRKSDYCIIYKLVQNLQWQFFWLILQQNRTFHGF